MGWEDIKTALHYVHLSDRYVLDAARVKASHALSYADAFAVATAVRLQATVVTGDAEFACVEELVEIRWI